MREKTNITIEPTKTEHVHIRHTDWNCEWLMQFPEMIVVDDAVAKFYAPLPQKWRQDAEQTWSYTWRPDEAYFQEYRPKVFRDATGHLFYELIGGLTLHASIAGGHEEVALTLTLTNETDQPMRKVLCDGGCFGARSLLFNAPGVIPRSYIWVDGRMVNLTALDRTMENKCSYQADPRGYERPIERQCEYFWGRSSARIGEPAILGAVSTDGRYAVVIGYQGSRSALANSKGNTCMHSRPEVQEISARQSVTRRGFILFGSDVQAIASPLRDRLLALR